MTSRMLIALAFLCIALTVTADDQQRERKARVALALAGKPTTTALAPAPRPASKTYPAGYKAATIDQMPLVVFVSCTPLPVDGAIVARADVLGDVTGPAVVVGFPVGQKLFIDTTLKGEPKAEDVKRAVEAAQRKIELPPAKAMPAAPRPLNWDL